MKEGEIHAVIGGVPMLVGKVGDESFTVNGVVYKKQDAETNETHT